MPMKLLVVVVDGATLDYIFQIPPEVIPTISELIRTGTYGTLESTMPPVSCPAWVSLRTGLNPGKLGFYNFYHKVPGEYKIVPVNYKVPIPAFWDILSEKGVKVAIVNAHLTYPANKVNGVMVSAVYKDIGQYCYPESFKQVLESKIGRLDYEVKEKRKFLKNPLEFHFQLEANRLRLCNFVLDSNDFDLGLFGFNIDRIKHFIKELSDFVKVYQKLDEILRSIIERSSPQNVILASDHGFGPIKGVFNINSWLNKNNFLSWENRAFVFLKRVQTELERRYLPKRQRHPGAYLNFIDWKNTTAFSPVECGIYINLQYREPSGSVKNPEYEIIRQAVIDRLRKTFSGAIKVHRREEVYSGYFLEEMPDIVYWIDEYESNCGVSRRLFRKPMKHGHIGSHRTNGLFIANGIDVKNISEKKAFNILDLAPTILYFWGLPIPTEYDGKVLPIFSEKSEVFNRQPVFASYAGMFKSFKPSGEFDDEEMAKRLRGLGYIE